MILSSQHRPVEYNLCKMKTNQKNKDFYTNVIRNKLISGGLSYWIDKIIFFFFQY